MCGLLIPLLFLQLDAITRNIDPDLAFYLVSPGPLDESASVTPDLPAPNFEWYELGWPSIIECFGRFSGRIQSDRSVHCCMWCPGFESLGSSNCCWPGDSLSGIWVILGRM